MFFLANYPLNCHPMLGFVYSVAWINCDAKDVKGVKKI